MMKPIAATLALVLSVACASTPMTSSSESAGGGVATTSVKNAPDYILLSAPRQVRTYDFSDGLGVRGLHVRGTMTSVGFIPVGDVLGSGKMCADGRDWLSLRDLKVYTAAENKTPTAPYILGCAVGNGFQPSSRTIVTQ